MKFIMLLLFIVVVTIAVLYWLRIRNREGGTAADDEIPDTDNSIPFTSEEIQKQLDNALEIPILYPIQPEDEWGFVPWSNLNESTYFKSYGLYSLYLVEGIITARKGNVLFLSDGSLKNAIGYGLSPTNRFTFQWQQFTAPTTMNPRLYITIEGTKNLIARKLSISDSAEEMAPGIVNLQTLQFENINIVIKDRRDVLVLTVIDHLNSN